MNSLSIWRFFSLVFFIISMVTFTLKSTNHVKIYSKLITVMSDVELFSIKAVLGPWIWSICFMMYVRWWIRQKVNSPDHLSSSWWDMILFFGLGLTIIEVFPPGFSSYEMFIERYKFAINLKSWWCRNYLLIFILG